MEISRSVALEIFGLKEGFLEADVKREYRRLVKIVHPDTGGDEKLFKLIASCKNILLNGENVSENTHETNEQKSTSYQNTTQSSKTNANITLEVLDDEYPDYLDEYEKEYNILGIKASLLIYIQPRFRKNLEKCITVNSVVPYNELNKSLNVVKFNINVKIPTEMQKFRKFKVRVKFLNNTYKFKVSYGDFKIIEHAKYEYVTCLKSICELHFVK